MLLLLALAAIPAFDNTMTLIVCRTVPRLDVLLADGAFDKHLCSGMEDILPAEYCRAIIQ